MIGTIIALVVIVFIFRMLSDRFAWIQYALYLVCLGVTIWAMISWGFWKGLLLGFGLIIAAGILRGLSTTYKWKGKEYNLKCSKCKYDRVKIVEEHKVGNNMEVVTKCPRCGNEDIKTFFG